MERIINFSGLNVVVKGTAHNRTTERQTRDYPGASSLYWSTYPEVVDIYTNNGEDANISIEEETNLLNGLDLNDFTK